MPRETQNVPALESGGPPQRNVVAWVLQGNPAKYNIDAYFSRQTFIYWNCPRFADQMGFGMPVFFKRSGPNGGVIAYGTVAEVPKPVSQLNRPEFLGADLWVETPEEDPLKVGIQLEDVRLTAEEGLIPTRELEQLSELEGSPLVTARMGTVFRLSERQAFAVFREWGSPPPMLIPPIPGAMEGGRSFVVHCRIERNRQLVEAKKNAYRSEHGRLKCEVCRCDFTRLYPADWIERFIEVHHLRPLSELEGPCLTRLEDLILSCRNCHALIHCTSDAEGNLRQLRQHFSTIE